MKPGLLLSEFIFSSVLFVFLSSCSTPNGQEGQKGQKRHCFRTFLVNVTSDLEKQLESLLDEQLKVLMNKVLENYNH